MSVVYVIGNADNRLVKTGHPLMASGLQRIEVGDRRVDVDDLAAP